MIDAWDLFPSPPWVVEILIENAEIEPGMSCLDPSAGFGNIALAIQKLGGNIQVIEILPKLQAILTLQNLLVIDSDFLTATTDNAFQAIVQNPPFSQQISHVKKAYASLCCGGKLTSLVSNSPWHYSTSFYKQFRHWLVTVDAQVLELPWGLFVNSDRYTTVECSLITISKTSNLSAQTK